MTRNLLETSAMVIAIGLCLIYWSVEAGIKLYIKKELDFLVVIELGMFILVGIGMLIMGIPTIFY